MQQKNRKTAEILESSRFNKDMIAYLFGISILLFPQDIHAMALWDIAKSFVQRTDSVYKYESKINPLDQIPDGGTLLMRPKIENTLLVEDIYSIKRNNEIYLALDDFIHILNLAIDYDDETGTGSGWFLREDWTFELNLAEEYVYSRGETYTLDPDDVYNDGSLNYIRSSSLETWFGMEMDFSIQEQIVTLETPFPFPSFAKAERDKRFRGRQDRKRRLATLPRLEQPKSMFDINTVDVSIGNRFQRNATTGDLTSTETASAFAQGEFLEHNGFIFMSANDEDNLSNVRARLFKRSDKPDLLGPLKAKSYSIGDISEVRTPLISDGGENFGVRVSNTTLDSTDFATTNIEGSAFPGWDVQLYRNGILIIAQTVGADGRYFFGDVQLFAGDNDFELFFYGPQGEIRVRDVSVPISRALLAEQDGTYEFSATLQDRQTYLKNTSTNTDADTVNVDARYNKLISDDSLGFIGLRTTQLNDERKAYLSTGVTSTVGNALLDGNVAVDEQGEAGVLARMRANYAGWDTILEGQYNTDDYRINDTTDVTTERASFSAQKVFNPIGRLNTSFLLNGQYRNTASGISSTNAEANVATAYAGYNLSNTLGYIDSDAADSEEEINYGATLRKNFGRTFLTLGGVYSIKPEGELETISGQVNHYFNNQLSADLSYNKNLSSDLERWRVNANYNHEKFRFSPYLQVNSDNDISGGINLNFGLYDDPVSPWPIMTKDILRGRGGLAGFVYHDKDGDMIFNNDDEPIEGAYVDSTTSYSRKASNEDGYSLINNLSVARPTDIMLDEETLPDPFMISGSKGHSILPTEGTIYNMEFPVHMTGEVDGNIFYYDPETPEKKINAGYKTITLHSLDTPDREPIEIRSERDGYYIGFMIPPGQYLMVAAAHSQYGNTVPQTISIGYEGTILQGVDIQMIPDAPHVPYTVTYDSEATPMGRILRVKKAGQSILSQTLNKLIQKQQDTTLYDGLNKIGEMESEDGRFEYYASVETNENYTAQHLHDACRAMRAQAIECTIIVNGTAMQVSQATE